MINAGRGIHRGLDLDAPVLELGQCELGGEWLRDGELRLPQVLRLLSISAASRSYERRFLRLVIDSANRIF